MGGREVALSLCVVGLLGICVPEDKLGRPPIGVLLPPFPSKIQDSS